MKKLKNLLIIGILGVIAFWIGLYAFRAQKPHLPPPKVSGQEKIPGQIGLQEINFTQVKEGVKLWELKAEAVTYQQPENMIFFKKILLTYFPKGEKPITLEGNLGNLDTKSKNVFIEGQVIVSTPEGYELKIPSLHYRDDQKEIYSDHKFSFKGPNFVLDGLGMTMNLESQKVKVPKRARMTFYQSFFKS
jgi:LPS export ABC transporter protein LptC